MHRSTIRLIVGVLTVVLPAGLHAQSSILGTVTEARTGRPIAEARVEATVPGGLPAGQTVSRAITDESGTFRVPNLEPGTYSVFVTRLGYQAQRVTVSVAANATANVTVAMPEAPTQLTEVVTTASRRTEKVIDAPATVSVVTTPEVQERPNVTMVDHLRALPGVDVAAGGLMQANVVARGFNNIFSGAMLTLTDNRFAFVPSLRVNVPYLIPETNEDIERIEVVLGPGAALYGPNTAGGVLHMITRSPFTSEGATLTIDVGERELLRGAVRTAWAPSQKFGVKGSYQYFRAEDWPTNPVDRDPNEIVPRDLRLERAGGQARVDLRPWENGEFIGTYGRTVAMNAVEPTGLGAGQVRDWMYETFQLRARHSRLFAQAFLNRSDAGETFLLRTNQPIVDESTQWVAQVQHGFDFRGHDLIYGMDYQATEPKTGGTVHGRNEDDDEITEFGGYLHGVARLSRLFEFVAAARYDTHNRVDEGVFSPRAALVWKPTDVQNVRLTYNRAFSQPSSVNLFLDLLAGRIPPDPNQPQLFGVRALGVPESGFTFRRDCTGGFDNLCMRVPAVFMGTGEQVPAQAAFLYRAAVAAAAPSLIAGGVPASIVGFLGTLQPTPAQVGTQLRVLNPVLGTFRDVAPTDLRDIAQIEPSINETYELGYKGVAWNRLQVVADIWREHRKNFVGPLIVETPNVFLDRPSLTAYLAAQLAPVAGPSAPVLAASIAAALAGISESTNAATRGIPLAVVNFDHPMSAQQDVILTYRNFGDLTVWGSDFAGELLFDRGFSLAGTFSHVSDDLFPRSEVGGVQDIVLNAPRTKGSLAVKYRNDVTGLASELRGRHVSSFPVQSGVFSDARVETYNLVDALFSWRPAVLGGALWSLSVQNLLDHKHKEFAGGAALGRLVMTRLQYTFGAQR